MVFLILTEWVINGSSSRRIPCNPKIGKRQQAQGRRQKAQLRPQPAATSPHPHHHHHQCLQMGKFSRRRKRQEWENIRTFPGLDFTSEPGGPAHPPLLRLSPTSPALCVAFFSTPLGSALIMAMNITPPSPIFHLEND